MNWQTRCVLDVLAWNLTFLPDIPRDVASEPLTVRPSAQTSVEDIPWKAQRDPHPDIHADTQTTSPAQGQPPSLAALPGNAEVFSKDVASYIH